MAEAGSSRFAAQLWDSFDDVAKHTEDGLVMARDLGGLMKRRAVIEERYAKDLAQLAARAKASLPKERGETSTLKHALLVMHEDTETLAGKHAQFACELSGSLCDPLLDLAKSKEAQRRKVVAGCKASTKTYLDALQALAKAQDGYHAASKAAASSLKASGDAQQSLGEGTGTTGRSGRAARAEQRAAETRKRAEAAHLAYQEALHRANGVQHVYHDEQLPARLRELQSIEEARIATVKQVMQHFVLQLNTLAPRWSQHAATCSAAVKSVSASMDLQMIIDTFATEKSQPEPIAYTPYRDSADAAAAAALATAGQQADAGNVGAGNRGGGGSARRGALAATSTFSRLVEIERAVDGLEVGSLSEGGARDFVRQGVATKVSVKTNRTSERQLFLLSDCLVQCVKSKFKQRLVFKGRIPLSSALLRPYTDPGRVELVDVAAKRVLMLQFAQTDTAAEWHRDLTFIINEQLAQQTKVLEERTRRAERRAAEARQRIERARKLTRGRSDEKLAGMQRKASDTSMKSSPSSSPAAAAPMQRNASDKSLKSGKSSVSSQGSAIGRDREKELAARAAQAEARLKEERMKARRAEAKLKKMEEKAAELEAELAGPNQSLVEAERMLDESTQRVQQLEAAIAEARMKARRGTEEERLAAEQAERVRKAELKAAELEARAHAAEVEAARVRDLAARHEEAVQKALEFEERARQADSRTKALEESIAQRRRQSVAVNDNRMTTLARRLVEADEKIAKLEKRAREAEQALESRRASDASQHGTTLHVPHGLGRHNSFGSSGAEDEVGDGDAAPAPPPPPPPGAGMPPPPPPPPPPRLPRAASANSTGIKLKTRDGGGGLAPPDASRGPSRSPSVVSGNMLGGSELLTQIQGAKLKKVTRSPSATPMNPLMAEALQVKLKRTKSGAALRHS